jgi:hypothetical protein
MSKGILTVAFGKHFEILAAEAMRYSRQFTDLPIHVLTNIEEKDRHNDVWKYLSGITFQCLYYTQAENRKAKLRMNEYSPFDETLYMDCDSVIQNTGVEKFIDFFDGTNLILNYNKTYGAGEAHPKIYIDTLRKLGLNLPLRVYHGALIGFKKTPDVDVFFKQWYKNWVTMGGGREMPSLCCAARQIYVTKSQFPKNWFSGTYKKSRSIIQHDYGKDFCRKFNLTKWKDYKPFKKSDDWDKVYL